MIQFFKRSYIPLSTFITFPSAFSTACMGVWFSQVGDTYGAIFNCSLITQGHTTDYLTETGFYGRSVYGNNTDFNQTNNDVYILAIGY